MSSQTNRCGRRVRANHSGNTDWCKFVARMHNRRFRHAARLILSDVLRGDADADSRLERHRRHTADWDAY